MLMRCSTMFFLLRWDPDTASIETEALPSLPRPCAHGQAALIGRIIYLAGGQRWPDTGDCHRSVMGPGPVATRKRFRLPVEDSPTHSRRGACLQPHLGSAQRISGQSLCSERKDSRPGRGALSGRLLGIPADELHLAAAQGSPKVCHGRKRRALGAKSLAGSGGSRRSAVSSGRCVEG